MLGLLERARKLRRGQPDAHASAPQSSQTVDESGVTPDERSELLSQIEHLFTERHPIESVKTEHERHRSKGTTFPVAVNLIAAAALVGAVLGFRILGKAPGSESSKAAAYSTTEGLVVKEVKQQAAQALGEREARIAAINRELENLRRSVQTNGPSVAVSARQQELEKELSALQSRASARLSQLSAQREQQAFLLRQLQLIYRQIQADVAGSHFDAALKTLSSSDSLLLTAEQKKEGDISAIAPALLAGNGVLREALLFGQSTVKAAASAELPAKIAEIDRLVKRGDDRFAAGDLGGARQLYAQAVTSITEVAHAYQRLDQMKQRSFDAETSRLEAAIAALRRGTAERDATIAAQEKVVKDQRNRLAGNSTRLTDQLDTINSQKLAIQRQREELATLVSSMKGALARGSAAPDPSAASIQAPEVVDMLKTKVAIRWLADTPEAKRTYPRLYDQLDSFFKEYADTYRSEGRSTAFREVSAALDQVLASLDLPASDTTKSSPLSRESEHNDPALGFLNTVDTTLGSLLTRLN